MFLLLIKRTMKVVDETTIDNIIFARLEKEYQKLGEPSSTVSIYMVNKTRGLIFIAIDLKYAKKFSSIRSGNYADIIQKTVIMTDPLYTT